MLLPHHYWASLTVDQWANMTVDQWAGLPAQLTTHMLAGGRKQYYLDPETQLYLLGGGTNGRYYDPNTARFLSEDPIRQQSGDDNLFAYVQDNPINRLDPSGHDADSTEHEQRQNEQRQLTLPALSEQVAHSQGSSRRAMQLPEQLGGDRGPGASSLVDRRQGGPGFMNPVDRGGSVSNPKESGLMGLFNAAAPAGGPGSAPSSPSVHIDGDPASGFSFAARPARPHMPHVHHGQHAHQVQRTPQGVVTPGVVAGDPMMGFQANARPSTPAESGDIGLPTTQRTTPLPQMLGQPGPAPLQLTNDPQTNAMSRSAKC